MKFHYYVGYYSPTHTGNQIGGLSVSLDSPITNLDEVIELQEDLRRQTSRPNLMVTAFSRYEERK